MKNGLKALRKINKRFIIIGLIILALVGFFIFPRRPQDTFEFYTVARSDIKEVVSASGILTGQNSLDLKVKSGGKITYLGVKEGDEVSQGQLLVSTDSRQQQIALNEAKNTLRDKQATVDKVIDDIHLFQYGMGGFANIGSSNETMTQRQLRTTAEVARDNAQEGVKSAQISFDDTRIVSPDKGIITQVNAIIGQTLSATDIVLKIATTDTIYFDSEIDEADIGKIKVGQKGEIVLDAYPTQTFAGEVSQIIPFTKTTTSGATIITVRIILSSSITFIQGLSGQAEVILSEAKNTLVIPIEALRDDDTVVVETPQGPISKKVVTGIRSDTEVEIKEGLSEGDKVIPNPPSNLNEQRDVGILRLFRGR
ncbi:efflux RND transporter periplasmic adaptor subunit [Candidatus Daviesbacteria bacterium]|nr:efflux RND transporter periplasmic adaptor subunit [Candidatus Daviesbacteria bacterium]